MLVESCWVIRSGACHCDFLDQTRRKKGPRATLVYQTTARRKTFLRLSDTYQSIITRPFYYWRDLVSQEDPDGCLQKEQQENLYEIFCVRQSQVRFVEGQPDIQSAAYRAAELAEQSYECIYEIRRRGGPRVLTFRCISGR